jgi:hypothetical protein
MQFWGVYVELINLMYDNDLFRKISVPAPHRASRITQANQITLLKTPRLARLPPPLSHSRGPITVPELCDRIPEGFPRRGFTLLTGFTQSRGVPTLFNLIPLSTVISDEDYKLRGSSLGPLQFSPFTCYLLFSGLS